MRIGIFVSIPSQLEDAFKMVDEEDCLMLLLLVVLLHRSRRRRRSHTKPRRFCVREIFSLRQRSGEFHNLVRELRLGDRELYFR